MRSCHNPQINDTCLLQAQWGERNGSEGSGSEDDLSAGDNFFEDESLGSHSSDSDEDVAMTPPPAEEIYKRYFGGRAWKGTVEKIEQSDSSSRLQNSESPVPARKMRPIVGPSSDMLAPVVSVTHDYDSIMLNHQSIALAREWELGRWDFTSIEIPNLQNPNGSRIEVDDSTQKQDEQASRDFESAALLSRQGGE